MLRLKGTIVTTLCLLGVNCFAVETEIPDVSGEEVVSGLSNPCGIAVQPGTGHVFVSDSAASRVVRFDPANPGELDEVVTGFPKDIYGKGPIYDIGPLGLKFLDQNTLAVGGGGLKDGQEIVRFYTVPEWGNSITADDMKASAGPVGPGDESVIGEGNFYALAVSPNAIFVTSNGDDTKGWVHKIDLQDNQPGDLQPFIKTKEATNVDAPVGITFHENYVVVGQMGEITVPEDSLLTFYGPRTGRMLANFETGLFDICDLAYSPSNERLYAVDFAWMDTAQGGLFRLDQSSEDGQQTVNSVKVAGLDKPTSLAFAPDGTLYVTIIGTAENDEKPGKVLKFSGDL